MTVPTAPLPADRLARRREHLMTETAHTTDVTSRPARLGRRGRALVGGLLAAAAVGGGAVAVAGAPAVWRMDNGMVAIDGQQLRQWHDGHEVTLDQVEELQEDGKAIGGLNSIELACRGIQLWVDTEAQNDAYGDGYRTRLRAVDERRSAARAAGEDPGTGDPCRYWTEPVPGLPDALPRP